MDRRRMTRTPRQRATWCAHLWKPIVRQHHTEMPAVFRPAYRARRHVIEVGRRRRPGPERSPGPRVPGAMPMPPFEPGSGARSRLCKVRAIRRAATARSAPSPLAMPPPRARSSMYRLKEWRQRAGRLLYRAVPARAGAENSDGGRAVRLARRCRSTELASIPRRTIEEDVEGSDAADAGRRMSGTLRRFGQAITPCRASVPRAPSGQARRSPATSRVRAPVGEWDARVGLTATCCSSLPARVDEDPPRGPDGGARRAPRSGAASSVTIRDHAPSPPPPPPLMHRAAVGGDHERRLGLGGGAPIRGRARSRCAPARAKSNRRRAPVADPPRPGVWPAPAM